jgi:hypothetical protein
MAISPLPANRIDDEFLRFRSVAPSDYLHPTSGSRSL